MEQQMITKLLELQDRMRTDDAYRSLMLEYEQHNAIFLAALETMEPQQKDAVLDFLGTALEMHMKMLELAFE